MGCPVLAEEEVWTSYKEINDPADRKEAWDIIRSLVDNPEPDTAIPNVWTFDGYSWPGYSIDLSSGHGFIPYSHLFLDDGSDAVRLWPAVWVDLPLG